jgi:hypothetical protein
MDKSAHPSSSCQSCSPNEQQGPSTTPLQHCASVPKSGVIRNAGMAHHTMGGKSVNLPPSGAVAIDNNGKTLTQWESTMAVQLQLQWRQQHNE